MFIIVNLRLYCKIFFKVYFSSLEKQFKIYFGIMYCLGMNREVFGQTGLGNSGLDKVKLLQASQKLKYAVGGLKCQ